MNKIHLITADTGPLIHLALAGKLELLNMVGTVYIPDLVVVEALIEGKPGTEEIRNWLAEGVKSKKIVIAETDTGEAVRLARLENPNFRMKNGGERAILDWLVDEVSSTISNVVVVYENGKVPSMIARHDSDLHAVVLTTKSFIIDCQKWGFLESSEEVWNQIVSQSPSVNDKLGVSLHGRMTQGGYEP